MYKVKPVLFLIFICSFLSGFRPAEKDTINWISFETMQKEYAHNPKPIIIDLYTNWCGWCKVMDKNTYSNPNLVKYINEKYYAVKFNAESKESIYFNYKNYVYDEKNRINTLALYLTYGRLEFPHTILLSSPDAQPAPFSGYLKPAQMESPLKYFGERADEKETFVTFNKELKKAW